MRLFGWLRRAKDKDETSAPIRERVEDLERSFKNIRLEWEDVYEINAKQLRKMAKRAERAAEGENGQEPAPATGGVDMSSDRSTLRAIARQRGLMR